MVSPDSEGRLGQGPEIEHKPRWIPVKDMVKEGTIGLSLVAGISDLGVRLRPKTTFNQPLASLWSNRKNTALLELQSRGMEKVGDVLRLTEDELSIFETAEDIKNKIYGYLENLLITPHGRVLEKIGSPIYPVPAEREQEIIDAVEKAVATLEAGREQETIILRFGLHNGVIPTVQEAGKMSVSPVTGARASQVEQRALRILRHPSRSKALRDLFSLPEESFGRKVFGAVFSKDLPRMIGEVHVSPDVREQIAEIGSSSPRELAWLDLRKDPLSSEARIEIESELRRIADETSQEEELSPTGKVFVETKSAEPPVNNLLPEITISEQRLREISKIPIEELNLSVRTENTLRRHGPVRSIGELLSFPRERLRGMRNMGVKSVLEIAEGLEAVLNLPEDKYRKGLVRELLISIFPPHYQEQAMRSGRSSEEWWEEQRARQRQKREERNRLEINSMRQIIQDVIERGATNTDQIQVQLIEKGERVFNLHPRNWMVRAMIEYVLNHPGEGEIEKEN